MGARCYHILGRAAHTDRCIVCRPGCHPNAAKTNRWAGSTCGVRTAGGRGRLRSSVNVIGLEVEGRKWRFARGAWCGNRPRSRRSPLPAKSRACGA